MTDEMPSVHDSLLTGYEVDGRARTITLHVEPHHGGRLAFIEVRFLGVAAYKFENDLLQNIVFDITVADTDEYASIVGDITQAGGRDGFPRGWDSCSESVEQFLARQNLRVFVLTASYGMTGWVAAESMTRTLRSHPRLRKDRAREIQAAIRDALMSEWDPIGIKDEPACQGEYDSYISGVYRLLASRATPEQIADHLIQIEKDMMGLRASHDRLKVAHKLAAIDVSLHPEE